MIGLDTNVLVRYITQDDPVQSATASAWIENRLTPENPGFISVVAMAEMIWVLERSYSIAGPDIATIVERILQADTLAVENEQEIFSAMLALKEGQGAFADALIAGLGARAGCSSTLAFDQKALRLPGFKPA